MNPLRGPAVAGQTLPLYRRPSRLRRVGAIMLGASAAVGVACGGGSSREDGSSASDWLQTDGANGRINLDDVHDAYKDSFDDKAFQVEKFEQRVNEIYEGDKIVIIKVDKVGDEVQVSGWEDLNDNKTLDEGEGDGFDDKLFTITQQLKDGAGYRTTGNGGNSYYNNSGGGFGNFFAGMFLGQLLFGGRTTYVMPPQRYDTVSTYRTSYREGSGYGGQQQRNQSYGSGVSSRYGPSATTQPVSPARSSYQTRQTSTGGFRGSTSTSRSISSGGKAGPITGGGGLGAR